MAESDVIEEIPDDVCEDHIGGLCEVEACPKRHIEFEELQREFEAKKKQSLPPPPPPEATPPQPQPKPAVGSPALLLHSTSPCSDEVPATGISEGISDAGVGVGGTPLQSEPHVTVTPNVNNTENSPPACAPFLTCEQEECVPVKESKGANICEDFRKLGYCMSMSSCQFEHPSDFNDSSDDDGDEDDEEEEDKEEDVTMADVPSSESVKDVTAIQCGGEGEALPKSGLGSGPIGPYPMDQSSNQKTIVKPQVLDVVNPDELPDEPEDQPTPTRTPQLNSNLDSSSPVGKRSPNGEPGKASPTKRSRVQLTDEPKGASNSTDNVAPLANDETKSSSDGKDVEQVEAGIANVRINSFDRGVTTTADNASRNADKKPPVSDSITVAERRDLPRPKPQEVNRALGVKIDTGALADRIDGANSGPEGTRIPRGGPAYEAKYRSGNQRDGSKYWRHQENARGRNGGYDQQGRGGYRQRRRRGQRGGRGGGGGGRGRQPNAVVSAPKTSYPAQVRGMYYCEVCDKDCGSQMSLEAHKGGKKHQNKVQAQRYREANRVLQTSYRSKVAKPANLKGVTQNAPVPVPEPPPPTPVVNEPDEDAPDSPPMSPLPEMFGTISRSPSVSPEPKDRSLPNDGSSKKSPPRAADEPTPKQRSTSPPPVESNNKDSKRVPSPQPDNVDELLDLPDPEDEETQIPVFMEDPTSRPAVQAKDLGSNSSNPPAQPGDVSQQSLQVKDAQEPSPNLAEPSVGQKSIVASADKSKLENALEQDDAASTPNGGQGTASNAAATEAVIGNDVGVADSSKEEGNPTVVPMETEEEPGEINTTPMEVENEVPAPASQALVPSVQRGWLTNSIKAGGHQPAEFNGKMLQPISNEFLNKKMDVNMMRVIRDMLLKYGGLYALTWKFMQELIVSPNMGMSAGRLPALEKLLKEIPLYNEPTQQADVFKWKQMHPTLRNSKMSMEEEAMYDRHYTPEELSVVDNIDDNLNYAMLGGPTEREETMFLTNEPNTRPTLRGRLHHQEKNYEEAWGYRQHDELITDQHHHWLWNLARKHGYQRPPMHPPSDE